MLVPGAALVTTANITIVNNKTNHQQNIDITVPERTILLIVHSAIKPAEAWLYRYLVLSTAQWCPGWLPLLCDDPATLSSRHNLVMLNAWERQ
jgi:hypothetical protein